MNLFTLYIRISTTTPPHVQKADGAAEVRGNTRKGKTAQMLAGGAKQRREVKAPVRPDLEQTGSQHWAT